MKREIRFRAWDTNEFLDEPEMYSNEKLNELDRDGLLHLYDIIEGKEPKVFLMQYTGLKDCTGKEIYEGDIIKGFDGTIGDVYFDKGCFMWRGDRKPLTNKDDEDDLDVNEWAQIIGNIYQTPELLNTPPVNP